MTRCRLLDQRFGATPTVVANGALSVSITTIASVMAMLAGAWAIPEVRSLAVGLTANTKSLASLPLEMGSATSLECRLYGLEFQVTSSGLRTRWRRADLAVEALVAALVEVLVAALVEAPEVALEPTDDAKTRFLCVKFGQQLENANLGTR